MNSCTVHVLNKLYYYYKGGGGVPRGGCAGAGGGEATALKDQGEFFY